ncbi:hypothetical protein MRX96_006213 [Rhipicephalus microplus]
MQVCVMLAVHALASASLGTVSRRQAACEPLWLDISVDTPTQCGFNIDALASQAAPPSEELWIRQPPVSQSSSASPTAIRSEHPGLACSGLGGYAREQSSNPLLFAMQVCVMLAIHALASASLGTVSHRQAACEPLWLDISVDTPTQCGFNIDALASQVAPPREELRIRQPPVSKSSSASSTAIKPEHPRTACSGLGGYAREQSSNPLLFAMQIGTFLLLILAGHEEAGKPTTAWTANPGRDKARHVQHAPIGLDGRPYKLNPLGSATYCGDAIFSAPSVPHSTSTTLDINTAPPSDGD